MVIFIVEKLLDFINCCFCTCCYHIIFLLCFVDMGNIDSFSNVNLDLTAWKILDSQCINPRLLDSAFCFTLQACLHIYEVLRLVILPFHNTFVWFGIREMLLFRINWKCSFLLGFWNCRIVHLFFNCLGEFSTQMGMPETK